jgi:hypothetical protein
VSSEPPSVDPENDEARATTAAQPFRAGSRHRHWSFSSAGVAWRRRHGRGVAEQRKPVRRRVALKLIKAGMDTREVVARFESERQALALMDHPAIRQGLRWGIDARRPALLAETVAAGVIRDGLVPAVCAGIAMTAQDIGAAAARWHRAPRAAARSRKRCSLPQHRANLPLTVQAAEV